MIPSWTASPAVARPVEDVADRRLDAGVDVEVVRQVALGVEVDGEDVEAGAPEDVGEMADGRGLARAALLGEDRDLVAPSSRAESRPTRAAVRPPPGPSCSAGRARVVPARRRRGDRSAHVEEVQAVAPDDDLVAVAQRAPLDALAVDEDAVEGAVVEDPDAVGLAHDQRVAARDRRVVEADVGGQAAADRASTPCRATTARPPPSSKARYWPGSATQRGRARASARAPRPGARARAGAGSARRRTARRGRNAAAAPRAVRKRVGRGQRHDVAALLTAERPGSRKGARRQ